MLNLLRFSAVADHASSPELQREHPVGGREAAYELYVELTRPLLRETGGDVMFLGEGGKLLSARRF